MSVLKEFERRLEGVVEGAFTKTFRSGLQPVELAKRIQRDMDAGRTIGADGHTWVPNRFAFRLAAEDHERFAAAEGAIAAELGQVVLDTARERAWGLMGPPEIVLDADPSLKRGSFRCDASLAEGQAGAAGAVAPAVAELNVLEGDRRSAVSFPISKPLTTIGRLAESDVTVEDPAASRQHAEIRQTGSGSFAVVDLGSTNGTSVNGARLASGGAGQTLSDGDRITIGQTVLEFRRAAGA
ncbi:MAG: DUF3662 and FHA domain-containing protein [Actinomycetota bacterium]